MTSDRRGTTGGTLKHEIAHTVLATQWPGPRRLPSWAEEAIASRYDDDARATDRRRLVGWWAQTGNWPRLGDLLSDKSLADDDLEGYAAAASVSEILLS